MSTNMRIDFPAIQTRLTEDELQQLTQAIRGAGTLSMGPYLKEFEQSFAKYIRVKHSFGLSNASAALELAAMLSGVREDDEVILPAHTFTATALPFMRRRARLVFADIDPDTWVMDIQDVRRKITDRTRVILPVHLYGLPVNMPELMEVAKEYNLFVIEDCAQSPGARIQGQMAGSFGDVACFSFHSQKNITTLGEGGMITTNHDAYAEQILGLRKIGQRPFAQQDKYWLPAMTNVIEALPGELPYNFALGEIQAFAGQLMLKRIEEINNKRRELRRQIIGELEQHPELVFQDIPEGTESACHLLPARFEGQAFCKHRDDLIEMLYLDFGIKSVVQYYPLYRYDLFRKNGYRSNGDCPNTDYFFDNMISIPFGTDFSESDTEYLIQSIDSALTRLKS